MRIGIIGPNKAPYLNEDDLKKRKSSLSLFAKIVAESGVEIILTPDKNSLLEFFGKEYLKNNGKKIYEVVPLDDDFEDYLNIELGEVISCGKWSNQPAKFNEECDVMFCVGYGGMVMAEIGFSGYYNPKTIYIINDFISGKLPKEIGLKIEYVELRGIDGIIKGLKGDNG
jgi:hypothetical protein